ncbi:MAG: NADH-quinone oxidoreductase subunit C [Planctomycetes bacterium]|nr:NADH-quinone oxidoreductase subunit C [Planctomycetota bacterium]
MDKPTSETISALQEAFSDIAFAPSPLMDREPEAGGVEQICVRVPSDRLFEVMRFLRDDARCRFEQLCDLTCVDYLEFRKARDRYGVNYSLLSLSRNHRLWIKCFVNDPEPQVPSVTNIWRGAEWLEREVWDLFGVRFTGHPDLRRIMTWEGFEAHPLRKDYPLRGRGEREDYPVLTRDSR